MAKIFISYNRMALPEVEGLSEDLRELWDHEVWFDRELTGGQRWWDNILRQIRDAEIFLFVLTPESLDSQACRQEMLYAHKLGRSILPLRFSEEIDSSLLYSPLNEIQYIDCRVLNRSAHASLRRAISAVPAPAALPDPLPEPPPVPLSYLGNLREQVDTGETLDFSAQAGLVLDIKGYLKGRGANARTEVGQLLKRLRQRPDLLAVVSAEIDEILQQLGPGDAPSSAAAKEAAARRSSASQTTPHVERAGRGSGAVEPASEPPAVFAMSEAVVAIKKAVVRVVRQQERWRLVLDEKNQILLIPQRPDGQELALQADARLRDTITEKKATALKTLGWEVGDVATAAKGVGAAAAIFATSGVAAVGLLSKDVRDFLLTCSAHKTWPSAQNPVIHEQVAMELVACLKKICDPDVVLRLVLEPDPEDV